MSATLVKLFLLAVIVRKTYDIFAALTQTYAERPQASQAAIDPSSTRRTELITD